MKNYLYFCISIVLLFTVIQKAQTVTDKLVDENGGGLAEVQLQLYAALNVNNASSGSDGSFTFNNVTLVEDEQLPLGYSVSNNYPNPFNPRTRFDITFPNTENVKIEVFNLLGQAVLEENERQFNAGTNNIDLELNDLPNLTIERYCPGTPTVLYEGKTYHTVQIGNQCWLKENLDVGTMIYSSTFADSMRNNGILEKYCYDNLEANCIIYGGLYQWNEATQYVTTEGSQGICPPGWHIPKFSEFLTLSIAIGDDENALIREDQGSGGGQGTNTSGFSALLAGAHDIYGSFNNLGYDTYFWSSTEFTDSLLCYKGRIDFFAILLNLHSYSSFSSIDSDLLLKDYGFSVRCLKD